MGDYNIDINVNMGGSQGNFQSLIDSINTLNTNMSKIGANTNKGTSKASASLYKFQGDITKLSETIAKQKAVLLENLSALEKLRMAYHEARRAANNSETATKKDAAAYRQASKAYIEQRKRVKENEVALNQLTSAQRKYNSILGQTSNNISKSKSSFFSLKNTLNSLAGVLGTSISLFGGFMVLKNIIKTIADFDLAQKKLRSVLGETAQGMNEISQSAIDVGKNSIFGAKGVTELQIELAKMGFTKRDIMAMQQAIVNLATATQEDLASSAETVANVIKTFQLSSTETTDVVNVMGKAFNDSALGLANFREAIKYVAPVANQAGLSFRETVAALELLSNAGLKGSLAGTGLNNVLKAMMDSNSKLSKQMGGVVSGWEGFTSVLVRAKEEGWNMQDIFGLITQRATGAFSTLLEGVGTLEEMEQVLQDVSNVMRDQAGVQMESIAYTAELLKKSWDALVLSIDSGNGIISKSIKALLKSLNIAIDAINAEPGQMFITLKDYAFQADQLLSLEGLSDKTKKELEKYESMLLTKSTAVREMSKKDMAADLANINELISGSEELFSKVIVEQAELRVKALKIEGKTYDEFEESRMAGTIAVGIQLEKLKNEGKSITTEYKILEETIIKIGKLRFKRADNAAPTDDAEAKSIKAIKDRFKLESDLLKVLKDGRDEWIKLYREGYLELLELEENSYNYNKEIINLELENAIKLNENVEAARKIHKLKMEAIELEHVNNLIKIEEDKNKKILEEQEKLLKNNMKLREKYSKDFTKDWEEKMKDLDSFMKDFAQDSPLLNMLFGQGIEEDLFTGILSEDDVKNFEETFNDLTDIATDGLNNIVDSWADATQEIVDLLNRQIDETQSALEVEAELMSAGYANNVTLKKKELEDLKKARETALNEQRKAQQAQVAIDTITQISSLITASAQIIKGFSSIPIVGTGLGIAAVALMLGAFTAAKVKALQSAGVAKFEKGGWINGRRHSEGGTMIEAEKGEFVVNRRSSAKHNKLIEAINKDDTYELNKIYLNNLKGQIVNARVSLDESKYLKGIYDRLGKEGKSVEFSGNYRIERVGNVTTKIRLN